MTANNPLLQDFDLPPYSQIKPEHVEPAVDQILADSRTAIAKLLEAQQANPSWDGLVLALDELGARLGRAWSPVSHLNAVCNSPELRALWEEELAGMRERIRGMRMAMVEQLAALNCKRDFGFVAQQRGMFSYSGLTAEQVERLKTEFGIYAVSTGRICVAALNQRNLPAVTQAIAAVL